MIVSKGKDLSTQPTQQCGSSKRSVGRSGRIVRSALLALTITWKSFRDTLSSRLNGGPKGGQKGQKKGKRVDSKVRKALRSHSKSFNETIRTNITRCKGCVLSQSEERCRTCTEHAPTSLQMQTTCQPTYPTAIQTQEVCCGNPDKTSRNARRVKLRRSSNRAIQARRLVILVVGSIHFMSWRWDGIEAHNSLSRLLSESLCRKMNLKIKAICKTSSGETNVKERVRMALFGWDAR